MSANLAALARPKLGASSTVFKSGPLFISSKGLGWKSWKKRWFILTKTSLVFFKNDPGALPQRGSEVNLTLGGIDLNNSGSVVIKEDKRLITVLFPDGRDGRAFSLKAETSEDLFDWKEALEQALSQAPSASLVMGHTGIFHNDANDAIPTPLIHNPGEDKLPPKSVLVGRTNFLAHKDIDGVPFFLEKALQFLETYATKVEGILRQSADVEEVEGRLKEYEQGNIEFNPDEDAHVIADCVKHVLRELPSYPVPTSCCTALLEAFRFDREEHRVNAMQTAIMNAFPEPNRRLFLRILKMMHTICSHSCYNRMTPPAVAACMAPLLLRPLLDGECEAERDLYTYEDNGAQLLAAANAANSAQAIIATLLEQYTVMFDDRNTSRSSSVSVESKSGTSTHDNSVDGVSANFNNTGDFTIIELYQYDNNNLADDLSQESSGNICAVRGDDEMDSWTCPVLNEHNVSEDVENSFTSHRSMGDILSSMEPGVIFPGLAAATAESSTVRTSNKCMASKRTGFWRRTHGRNTLSSESVDSPVEEELAIRRLETAKNDLQQRIIKEVRGNALLQSSLENRKQALHNHRFTLEQDMQRLKEQLKTEKDFRAAMECGIMGISSDDLSCPRGGGMDLKEIALAEADVARLRQRAAELHHQLSQKQFHHHNSLADVCNDSPWLLHNHSNLPQPDFVHDDEAALHSMNHEEHNELLQSLDHPRHASTAASSSALVELSSRLVFFKERRSQLVQQLRELELDPDSPPPRDFIYKPSSPPWK